MIEPPLSGYDWMPLFQQSLFRRFTSSHCEAFFREICEHIREAQAEIKSSYNFNPADVGSYGASDMNVCAIIVRVSGSRLCGQVVFISVVRLFLFVVLVCLLVDYQFLCFCSNKAKAVRVIDLPRGGACLVPSV